ncbi:MAG: GTP-sensing pleiotropic transcriptional regulator CodY [Firmicutes bacterium]|nr:GTP-sensing pleiotropic transcriptional regulator CodY [Bacillota bacterium]
MQSLLQKTRSILHLFQQRSGGSGDFGDVAGLLRESLSCNVLILNRKGELLGVAPACDSGCEIMKTDILGAGRVPFDYNDRLLLMEETVNNLPQDSARCVFCRDKACDSADRMTTVVPVTGDGERLGTLVLNRQGNGFGEADLVIAEYTAMIMAMKMLRSAAVEAEEEGRKRAAVEVALGTLSYSEMEAVHHIFDELNGTEGFLVASKIADRVGITRSVIVNALRKFESAGVIESRSLGMKGTFIRVLNDKLVEELARSRR